MMTSKNLRIRAIAGRSLSALAAVLIALSTFPGCIEPPTFIAADGQGELPFEVVQTEVTDVAPFIEVTDVAEVSDVAVTDKGEGDSAPPDSDSGSDAPPEVVVPACSLDEECEDTNSCTSNRCEVGTCVAVPTNVGGGCDDGFACTVSDSCNAQGVCAGTIVVCDDGNPCTDDSCDPISGACMAPPGIDGQPCSQGLSCVEMCTAGVCGCGCPAADSLTLTFGSEVVPMTGTVVLNPFGDSYDTEFVSMPALGPLLCPADWVSTSGTPDQLGGYPTHIVWTRPCVAADAFSAAAVQYANAGGSYWHAKDAGLLSAGSKIQAVVAGATAEQALPGLHVVSVEPTSGACVMTQEVSLRANFPEETHMFLALSSTEPMRVERVELKVGDNPVAILTSPLDYHQGLVPAAGDVATMTVVNPCGGPITDALFGTATIQSWGITERSGTLWSVGFSGQTLGAMSIYDATLVSAGTCVDGSRTSVLSIVHVEHSL